MSATRVTVSSDQRQAFIEMPRVFEEPIEVRVPEFTGRGERAAFAVQQTLVWKESSSAGKMRFRLDANPEEVGIDFKGSLAGGEDELVLQATIRNVSGEAISAGHSSVLLDTAGSKSFDDPTGERSFMYAEAGWTAMAELVDPIHTRQHTVRIGAAYKGKTVMWKLIARQDTAKRILLALAMDKGYAFASEHPDWGQGLLGGYRWGTINPQETKALLAKIYFLKGGLNDLRLRYVNDFK